MRRRELDWSSIDDPVDDDYDEPHIPYGKVRCACGELNDERLVQCVTCYEILHECHECGVEADEWLGGRWTCDFHLASGGRGEVDE